VTYLTELADWHARMAGIEQDAEMSKFHREAAEYLGALERELAETTKALQEAIEMITKDNPLIMDS